MNQSIVNAIRCLRLLASHKEPLGVREMSRLLDLDPAKVMRILKTMSNMGFVHQDLKRKYSIGWGVYELSAQSIHNSAFFQSVLDIIESVELNKMPLAIGILSGKDVIYLVHTGKAKNPIDSIGNYDKIPAISSIVGIKLLSILTDEEIINLLGINDFKLSKEDIYQARISTIYIKKYPFNEYRFAKFLNGGKVVIAISNVHCSEYELNKYSELLESFTDKIQTVEVG